MPLFQRRRPAPPPLILVPRQSPTPTTNPDAEEEGPESPDSAGTTPGPDSPDSPSPTGAEFEGEEREEEEEDEEEEAPADQVAAATSNVPQITNAPTDLSLNENNAAGRPTSTVTVPASSAQSKIAGGAAIGTEPPQKGAQHNGGGGINGMGKGAEAALITFTVLGGLALIIGVVMFLLRRRRRAKGANPMRHAEDAFNPSNTGSLQRPESVLMHNPHQTRSTNTPSLFGGGHYQRPETVSTDKSASRIPAPEPTPNPFADPPLNKAFDQLRGRPRSTTLTDRGSWVGNPFQDPASERFDPFGELQEKARQERLRYMEELRREQDELEMEREAVGLGPGSGIPAGMNVGLPGSPKMARKASGVTVEGLGVLDRSSDGRFPR